MLFLFGVRVEVEALGCRAGDQLAFWLVNPPLPKNTPSPKT